MKARHPEAPAGLKATGADSSSVRSRLAEYPRGYGMVCLNCRDRYLISKDMRMYVYIYIYTYIHLNLHMHMHIHVHVHIYYTYTYMCV